MQLYRVTYTSATFAQISYSLWWLLWRQSVTLCEQDLIHWLPKFVAFNRYHGDSGFTHGTSTSKFKSLPWNYQNKTEEM